MDSPDREDLEFDIDSLGHLQIPTLSVSGTPASWISRSKLITNKMAFQYDGDSSCDEAASSLGDSSYDFLDDRSATTDDEERDLMAESTSSESLEGHRQSSISTTWARTSQESHSDHSPVSLTTPTIGGTNYGGLHPPQGSTEEESLAEDPEEPIQFEEPSVVNLSTSRLTEVCHTLRTIKTPSEAKGDLHEAIKALPETTFNITVRQTMASHSIELDGKPYKVLVVGDDPATELVIKKIASALAANIKLQSGDDHNDVNSAKFSIVPVSAFGDSGHPDVVLIDSSGLELSVEYCTGASYVPSMDRKDSLYLQMADGDCVKSSWVSSKAAYVLSKDWKLPDLAILFLSEEDDRSNSMTVRMAQSFMHRHGVPSIVMRKKASWTRPTTLDYLTPHLCLESQQPNGGNFLYKRRVPIDLPTFLNIDAAQLNRNLACLAQSRRSQPPKKCSSMDSAGFRGILGQSDTWKTVCQTVESFGKAYTPNYQRFWVADSSFRSIASFLLFSVLISTLISLATFGAASRYTSLQSTNSSITSGATQLPVSTATAPAVSSITSTSSHKLPTKSLSSNTDIASFLLDAYALGPDRSDDFLVQLLGDRHIVVNTPRWMQQSKRAPALLFEVSRQNKSIEYTSSKIGEGVYALQIPHEEAYGMLNVDMTIKSKPVKQKNFEVDFGSSWLQAAAWKRVSRVVSNAVRKDLSIFQTGLSTVCNHSMNELSTIVHQLKQTLAEQKNIKSPILASYNKYHKYTRDLVLAPSKALAEYASRVRRGKKQIAYRILSLKKDFTQSVAVYHRKPVQTMSYLASICCQRFNQVISERQAIASEYLKATQKKVLTAWWKIVGVPKTSRLHKKKGREDVHVHECFG